MQRVPIPSFGPVNSLTESTEIGTQLTEATNICLRPDKGFSGCLIYHRLFAIGSETTVQETLRALPFTGYLSGVGIDAPARAANKTIAVRVQCQGQNFLLFYDLTATEKACRGWFYLGQDDSAGSTLDLSTGTPVFTVLAVGLNAAARWYGSKTFSQWMLGNGVDDNVCVQLNRTATPGIWRKAGSNVKPTTPTIALVNPASDDATQATFAIPQWGGPTGKTLTFTAKEENYPGESGNDRITVAITPSLAAISSILTGTGTPSTDPFYYHILGGSTPSGTSSIGPTPETIASFVNSDSKILAILQATVSTSGTSLPSTTPVPASYLAGGVGSGGSSGFSDRTATVYLRYWDPGEEGLGYEGISSEPSNTLIIPADSNKDILVTVPVDPSAEGGRFPFIRIYLNFGEGAAEIFSLMNPANPVPNTTTAVSGLLFANPANSGNYPETLFCYSLRQSYIAQADFDTFAPSSGSVIPANGTPIMFATVAGGVAPTGLTQFQIYYVIEANTATFKVSATLGGPRLNFTTNSSNTLYGYSLTAHNLTTNAALTLAAGSGGTLPGGITGGSTYYARKIGTYTFQLADAPEGDAVPLSNSGTVPYSFTASAPLSVRTVQLGLSTPIGQAMSLDQNRPLPHKHHAIANSQVWRAGVTGFQERLYVSKPATVDELAPEGANAEDWIIVQSEKNAAGANAISALYSDGFRLYVHTASGIILLDPADPSSRMEPQVDTGAINGASLCVLPDRRIYYLGANMDLMAFDASLNLNEIVGNASIAAASAIAYIRSKADTDAIATNPDRAHLFLDKPAQMLWYFVPGLSGDMIGFAYDLMLQGIVGPFEWPRIYASTQMQPTRPEIVFADEDANLFFYDPTRQVQGDSFGASTAFAPIPTDDPIPVGDAGYGNVVFNSLRYRRAYWATLTTGYWDLGDPENRKAFLNFLWRTLAGSRALFRLTFTTLNGQTSAYYYGDVGQYGVNHRALLMASDTAIQAKIEVLSAEQKPWAVRDCAFNISPQGIGSV